MLISEALKLEFGLSVLNVLKAVFETFGEDEVSKKQQKEKLSWMQNFNHDN